MKPQKLTLLWLLLLTCGSLNYHCHSTVCSARPILTLDPLTLTRAASPHTAAADWTNSRATVKVIQNPVFRGSSCFSSTSASTNTWISRKKSCSPDRLSRQQKEKEQGLLLVEFGHINLDVAEVRPLCRVLGPAALHQDGQLLRVVPGVGGRPEVRLLPVPHLLHDLCGHQ